MTLFLEIIVVQYHPYLKENSASSLLDHLEFNKNMTCFIKNTELDLVYNNSVRGQQSAVLCHSRNAVCNLNIHEITWFLISFGYSNRKRCIRPTYFCWHRRTVPSVSHPNCIQ